ncbi:hypothetical protein A4H97_13185 [Niastella yeongjuensis]|uniref:Entericidin n=1 Tax=Niastella yeongjuensis TaxID=354355 RepID=A0A1V9EAH5_9BACT|nr:hypothetical protein [Niastella yeongjuensis]OQP43092.1 hypothetical protein A4H97_13185 [Niastella yeongjuensis]SEO66082.1 hypothetical protein SAMN05660816_03308 [Niastella yeongjuensis]
MKKLLLVLAIGSLFAVACNDGGSADTEQKADTTAPAATVDTAAAATVDTAAPAPVADTTKKVDTTKKK